MSTELPLEATDEEFSTFLRETCGIETNSFTVRQARTAAKGHTDLWKDVCERWDREPKSLVDKCLGPWARRAQPHQRRLAKGSRSTQFPSRPARAWTA